MVAHTSAGGLIVTRYVVQGWPGASDTYKVTLMLALAGQRWSLMAAPETVAGPALLADGQPISEAGVILDFLAEQTRRFGPKSEDERRQVLRWMLFEARCLGGSRHALPRPAEALALVDGHLAHHDFLLGRRLTIADVALGGALLVAQGRGLGMNGFVQVENWLDRIRAQPGWRSPDDLAKP